jgi:hypothetical protein
MAARVAITKTGQNRASVCSQGQGTESVNMNAKYKHVSLKYNI